MKIKKLSTNNFQYRYGKMFHEKMKENERNIHDFEIYDRKIIINHL